MTRFRFPRLPGSPCVGIDGLLESELYAIMSDPSRAHDLRLDAYEELKRREEQSCRCRGDALSGLLTCDFHSDYGLFAAPFTESANSHSETA